MAAPQRGISRSGEQPSPGISAAEFTMMWNLGGTPHARDGIYKMAQWVQNSGGTDLSAEPFADVVFGTEVERDTDFFSVDGVGGARKKFLKAGWYRVSWHLGLLNDTGSDVSIKTRIRKNNATNLGRDKRFIFVPNSTDFASGYWSGIFQFAADDYITLQATLADGAGNADQVAEQSWIMLELLQNEDETMIGGQVMPGRAGQIHRAIVTKGEDDASSGNTTIDILKNGTTILGSGSLSIGATVEVANFDHSVFSDLEVSPDDVFEVVVDATTTPPARDIGILIFVRPDLDSSS